MNAYQLVEETLIEAPRNDMDLEQEARDERAVAQELAAHRGLPRDFADDLAAAVADVMESPEDYSSEERREKIESVAEEYHG